MPVEDELEDQVVEVLDVDPDEAPTVPDFLDSASVDGFDTN